MILRLSWTHTGEREQPYKQMNDKHLFGFSIIHLTQVVCPSAALPQVPVIPLRSTYIITCNLVSEMRNARARDQRGVLWRPTWREESQVQILPPDPTGCVITDPVKEFGNYRRHSWMAGRSRFCPHPHHPCHRLGLLSSHSGNFTPTLTSISMLRRLVEGRKMIICCHPKSWQPPKISYWKLDCPSLSSLITHKMYIYKVKTVVKWLTIRRSRLGESMLLFELAWSLSIRYKEKPGCWARPSHLSKPSLSFISVVKMSRWDQVIANVLSSSKISIQDLDSSLAKFHLTFFLGGLFLSWDAPFPGLYQ